MAQKLLITLLALTTTISAAPLPKAQKTTRDSSIKLAINQDFADPGLLQEGNTWYAFASNNHKSLGNASAIGSDSLKNIQIATSTDFNTWTVTGKDALPTVGAWALKADPKAGGQGAAVWAPSAIKNANNRFVLYYAAASNQNSQRHCIGAATADHPLGPFVPEVNPIVCPLDRGGAIDPSGFRDIDGTFYVVYKIDGNSIGPGGACGNGNANPVPTPLMLQKLQSDGKTPVGSPIQLLDRDSSDGPLIENPALIRTQNGKYVLTYSHNCFSGAQYNVGVAMADSLTGPYTKKAPLLSTHDNMFGPGGMQAAGDMKHAVFHAGNVGPNNSWPRKMYVMQVNIDTAKGLVTAA